MSLPADADRPRYAPRSVDPELLREVAAVVLIVLGAIGLGVIAYVVDWRLGAAYTCAATIAAGVLMGLDR